MSNTTTKIGSFRDVIDGASSTPSFRSPGHGDLHDYETGEYLRPASDHEMKASLDAAESDGGAGAIEADGRVCYVVGEEQYDDSAAEGTDAPAMVRQRLVQLGLSQQELARQLDVDPRTVRRWVAGDTPVPASVMDEVNGLVARASQDAHDLVQQIREDGALEIGHPPEGVPSEAWWDRICVRALATLADVKIV